MENNIVTPNQQAQANTAFVQSGVSVDKVNTTENNAGASDGFKFFGCCSKSLKRFSVVIFIMNIFLSLGILGAVIVKIIIELGTAILPLLAVPIFTLFVLLIIISRFVSALIYGFAEIVEKSEK